MRIEGTAGTVSLEPGEQLSSVRIKVAGHAQPVILNLPGSLARQLGVVPDDLVVLTLEVKAPQA